MPTRTQPTKKFPQGRWCSNRIGGRTFTFDTREQALTWEAAAKDAVAKGMDVPDNRVAVKNSSLLSVVESFYRASRTVNKTKDNYRSMCNTFMRYWTPDTPIHAIDTREIREFLIHAQDNLSFKNSTVNHHRLVLQLVMKHAYQEGLITEKPKFPRKLPNPLTRHRFLTEEEEVRLLRAFNKTHWRDLTKFQLYTGLRVGEALSVRPMDRTDDETRGSILQVLGKGRKNRVIPLSDTAKSALPERTLYDQRYFPFTYDSYARSFRRACHRAGLDDVVIHTLRHTCFSRLAMKDVGVTKIQALAGHTDLKTTQRYMHLAPSYLDELAKVIG
jgi:integrase